VHIEKLRDVYPSPNTINVFKSRDRRWAGDVARVRAKRSQYEILAKIRQRLGDLGIDVRMA
jgi:hypothetical protein